MTVTSLQTHFSALASPSTVTIKVTDGGRGYRRVDRAMPPQNTPRKALGPVATYTAVDPEGATDKLSLAVVNAEGDALEDDAGRLHHRRCGVLTCSISSPDYENPTGDGPGHDDQANVPTK